jgi:pyruvate dehydrogenase E2 component (dihydrolipoamide acetyltransferase)
MTDFRLPDLGEGLQEAEIIAWHVTVGDHVVADQPLASVETDKAVVEIPSPRSGRIAALHGAPGDIVKIGAPLVDFEEAATADAGTVVGEIETAPETAPVEVAKPGRIKASPAVRALARKLGVDLAELPTSGPGGSVTTADVERVAAGLAEDLRPEPLRGVRRAMAARMTRAHAEVVPASVTDEADVGSWQRGEDVTLRLIRAVVAGCRTAPALNAWYLGADEGRVLHEKIHLGIAVDTADGLFVPVLRDVGNRPPGDLRRGLERMKADIQERRVPVEELRGQTITLSNFGMYGGRHAALVIVPPQVAILGAGRIDLRVVAVERRAEVRPVLPLSLSFDHRVIMGGEAARFLAAAKTDLEQAR